MSMTSASNQYFQEHAGEWDTLREGYFGEEVRQSAIAKAYLRPEMEVADVGAGTGFMTAGIAPLVKLVNVIDGSPTMLDVARENLKAFKNIVYHEADGLTLPLPDANLDVVFANMYLHHCPEPLESISEMVRLLRPGGRLVITDMDVHYHEWMKKEMADEWMGFERFNIREWFQDAGLVNIIVDCTGESCCAKSQDPYLTNPNDRSARISVFIATGTLRVSGMRQSVQERYGAIAENEGCGYSPSPVSSQICCEGTTMSSVSEPAQTSCCSEGASLITMEDINIASGYSPGEISSVPSEASEISLGCGNPIALADLKPGEVVLDIGSGGGLDALLAAQKVGPTGKVIGVDMTQSMLERARQNAKQAGLDQVEFRSGYAEDLPVEDASVDLVISNCVINLCEDKGLAFREIFRVLRPGGRLEVSDIVTNVALPYQLRAQVQEWAACVSGALPEREYQDLIAQAGFHDLTVRLSTEYASVGGLKVYSSHFSAHK